MKPVFTTILLILLAIHFNQAQNINQEFSKDGIRPYLLGEINKKGLTAGNYNSWFEKGYRNYEPNQDWIDKIVKPLKAFEIVVFLGTWCGDSRREVPRFYKLLESINYPMNQLTVIAVSREPGIYKQSPNHEEKGLNIQRVPTFIFHKNGREVNRIIESPVKSLEEDMYSIIYDNYVPKYHTLVKNDKFN